MDIKFILEWGAYSANSGNDGDEIVHCIYDNNVYNVILTRDLGEIWG